MTDLWHSAMDQDTSNTFGELKIMQCESLKDKEMGVGDEVVVGGEIKGENMVDIGASLNSSQSSCIHVRLC